jgi:hypothetical protein
MNTTTSALVKTCGKCKQTKEFSFFYSKSGPLRYEGRPSGYSSNCKACISELHKTDRVKERRLEIRKLGGARNSELKREYGITLNDYYSMLALQGGACRICKRKDSGHITRKNLCVDHDHRTGRVRGLLCNRCNHAVGLFNDNPDICLSAAEYLTNKLPELT